MRLIHGDSSPNSPHYYLFRTWRGIMYRCYNTNAKCYADYGGRGIRVVANWHQYPAFQHDILMLLGERPTGHSLDRYPNNNRNYEPGNVRWATRAQQMRNTRINKYVAGFGKTLCITEWAEMLDIERYTLNRLINEGHSLEWILYCYKEQLLEAEITDIPELPADYTDVQLDYFVKRHVS